MNTSLISEMFSYRSTFRFQWRSIHIIQLPLFISFIIHISSSFSVSYSSSLLYRFPTSLSPFISFSTIPSSLSTSEMHPIISIIIPLLWQIAKINQKDLDQIIECYEKWQMFFNLTRVKTSTLYIQHTLQVQREYLYIRSLSAVICPVSLPVKEINTMVKFIAKH